MALEIRNAPGQPGYAHLVFDRDIAADPLRIAIRNLIKREYLGQSVGKPNWTPARNHFFKATLVERTDGGRSVFQLGPEVTTFIPDEATVELTSEDETIREVAVWSGILLDFHWKGPTPEADDPEARRLEEDARKKRAQDEKSRQQRDAEAKKRDEADRARHDAEARLKQEQDDKAKADAAAAAAVAAATAAAAAAAAAAAEERRRLAKLNAKPRSPLKLLAVAAFVAVLIGIGWGTQNKQYLCDHFSLFCDAETLTYRAVESCAADKTCGANSCLVTYRRDFPAGRYRAQIDRIGELKGAACVDPSEIAAYERAKNCSATKTCGVGSCFDEYLRNFANGPHSSEITLLNNMKGGECPVDTELLMFDRAKSCASPLTCGAGPCLAEYRRNHPNGRFKAQIDQIGLQKGANCAAPPPPPTPVPPPPVAPPPDPLPPFRARSASDEAGINCAALRNPVPIEEMICADADFAHENAELQRAFDARIARLGRDDRTRLRQQERDWIARRDGDCNVPPSGTWDVMQLRRLKSCVIDKTRSRRDELQQ